MLNLKLKTPQTQYKAIKKKLTIKLEKEMHIQMKSLDLELHTFRLS